MSYGDGLIGNEFDKLPNTKENERIANKQRNRKNKMDSFIINQERCLAVQENWE